MFNIGLFELIIIFFFLIILVKPEEIPKVSKNLGLFYRKINRYIYNLKYELDDFETQSLQQEVMKNKSKKKSRKNKKNTV